MSDRDMIDALSARIVELEARLWRGIKTLGTFEYHVCRGCRLVETHATALDELLSAAGKDGVDNITTLSAPVDAPPAEGPYR